MTRPPTAPPDPDHPHRTGRATRVGGDRRPYPTAPTLTRPSPDRGSGQRRARADGEPGEPTPSTVWLCDTDADTDTDGSGLAGVVTTIVTSFSTAGDRVGVLAWPAPTATAGRLSGFATAPGSAGADTETLRAVVPAVVVAVAVAAAGRMSVLLPSISTPETTAAAAAEEPASQRRWAVSTGQPPEWSGIDATSTDEGQAALPDPAPLDLIITVVEPDAVDDTSAARTTLTAAHALRRGGILTVLTHCDRQHGWLVDPGGLLVTAGQNADLLYLQHIVAVHAPIRDGHIHPAPSQSTGQEPARWPAFHRRVHSDVYVLAQQQDHYRRDPEPLDGADPGGGDDR